MTWIFEYHVLLLSTCTAIVFFRKRAASAMNNNIVSDINTHTPEPISSLPTGIAMDLHRQDTLIAGDSDSIALDSLRDNADRREEAGDKEKAEAKRLSPPPFTIGAYAHLLHLPFRFFDLPAELRDEVYSHLWHSYELRIHLYKDYKRREVKRISHKVSTSIFRVSRQVYLEASAVIYERIRPNVISDIKSYFPNCNYHYRRNSVYTLVQKCAQLRLTVADERGLTTPDTYDGLLDAVQSILESRDQK